ncbi:hypothetical protein TNCV_320701 [Trichonephila clavipes]|nr:hypothetical protein TNCV_320701 [Trichonephila clavipes]
MCCTSIEEVLKGDTSLADLYALQRQIMHKFARLDTTQEHILELLLGDETLSGEYEDDFKKAEKYRDKMNLRSQLSAEIWIMQNATGKIKLELSEQTPSFRIARENARKVHRFFGAPRAVMFTGSRATGLGEMQKC